VSWHDGLPPGVYERLIDRELDRLLKKIKDAGLTPRKEAVDASELPFLLSRYIGKKLLSEFRTFSGETGVSGQIALANRIIALASRQGDSDPVIPSSGAEILLSVPEANAWEDKFSTPPLTGLSESTLLTGAPDDPSLASELSKEIRSADRIDILMSFIKWSGILVLRSALEDASSRAPVRIVTTTYMGATDLASLDFLSGLPNVQIRISLDESRTRLHAKAWYFGRNSGFSTAYIGSSNLSNPALTSGLEWNLKVTEEDQPSVLEKIHGTFETYWNDATSFLPYSSSVREKVDKALLRGRRREDSGPSTLFDVTPYPFQQEILDRLVVERTLHRSCRNLIVCATGTGKTVIAAFDFLRYREACPEATFLFVAHRQEILDQSRKQFRHILGDRNFGEMLIGENRPKSLRHLFASIQTIARQEESALFKSDTFDYVVIDEIHHGMAPTYRRLLDHLKPKILLGLTATPERHDGLDIRRYFNDRTAAEIRLGEAIDRDLLCPFHYFGVSDSVDYRNIRWERGQYAYQDLEDVLTGNDMRNRDILRAIREYLPDLGAVRGLGFCVSVRHAREMSELFNRAGLSSTALSAETPKEERESASQRLSQGEIRFVFVVDLYNEGVDIPAVNTVLFLRPTESLTVFLQQLGRGLRHYRGKTHLLVLDFIGHMHGKFDFSARLSALSGSPVHRIELAVLEDFPHLPAGCVIRLERVAREYVLENVRQSLGGRRDSWFERIREMARELGRPPRLREFVEAFHPPLSAIYKKRGNVFSGWKRMQVQAGVLEDFSDPDESVLTRGVGRVFHAAAGRYHDFLLRMTQREEKFPSEGSMADRMLLMAHYSLWGEVPRKMGMVEPRDMIRRFQNNPVLCAELEESLELSKDLARYPVIPGSLSDHSPLDIHAAYTRDEILAAFGLWDFERKREVREGVRYLPDQKADLLFVTLNKSEKDYSPSTLYEDYAISERLFHWQSQSTTGEQSETGRRYIHHERTGNRIFLFVRKEKKSESSPFGMSEPYVFAGPVRYRSHQGSRPMSIVWELDNPLPAQLFRESARLAVRV
jgi:superfamily II DNA or RNA helicase/HKD family nuclease